MTDVPESRTRAPSRHPLWHFVLPVALLHGLLLAALPYWPEGGPAGRHGVDVELSPLAPPVQTASETTAPAETAAGPPSPAPPAPRPRQASAVVVQATSPASQAYRDTGDTATAPVAAPPSRPVAADAPPPNTMAAAPPPPAAGRDGRPGDQAWRDDYRSALRGALARYHRYPARARRFGLSGTAEVGFAIRRDGVFQGIHLVRSSQAELLDQAALDTVRRLGRFRPLPAGYSEDSWAVSVPLVYRLD